MAGAGRCCLCWLLWAHSSAVLAEARSDSVEFDLQTRQKLQWLDNEDFSGSDQLQYHQRWLASVTWSASMQHLLHAELNLASQHGQRGPHSPQEHNVADVQQLYWQFNDLLPGQLRLGRQVWTLELQRQLGSREGTNVRRAFDGVLWTVPVTSAAVDDDASVLSRFYHGWHVQAKTGMLNDRPDGSQSVSVLAQHFILNAGHSLYWHYIRARDNRALVAGEPGSRRKAELRHVLTVGTGYASESAVEYVAELSTQRGQRAGQHLQSWWGYGRLTLLPAPFRPYIGASYASGDSKVQDGRDQRFAPLFAKSPFYTEAGIIATTNVRSMQLGIDWQITPGLNVDADVQHLQKNEAEDLWYSTSGAALAGSLAGSNERAFAYNVRFQWQTAAAGEFELVVSRLWHQREAKEAEQGLHQQLSFAELIWHYPFF